MTFLAYFDDEQNFINNSYIGMDIFSTLPFNFLRKIVLCITQVSHVTSYIKLLDL